MRKIAETAPIPLFSLAGGLSPLLVVPAALPLLAALFAPELVLDRWAIARRFTQWVQASVPWIDIAGHARSTEFVQVATLTNSLSLVIIPLLALVWILQGHFNYPRLLARRRAHGRLAIKQHLLIALAGPPLVLGAIYMQIAVPGDPSFASGFTTRGRAGFGFLGSLMPYLHSLILGCQVVCARLFIDTYINPKVSDAEH